jgi:hypothetical protein
MVQGWYLRKSRKRRILFQLIDCDYYGFVQLVAAPNTISIGNTNLYYRHPQMCWCRTEREWLDVLNMISHEVLHIMLDRIGEPEASYQLDDLLQDDGSNWYDWSGLPEGVPNRRTLPNFDHIKYH